MSRENALKDYVTVNERIMKFYELHPDGRIIPELISWENGVIVIKTSVYRNALDHIPAAVGHAYEKEGSSFINKTSALENCETSSVGRALALLGLEIKKSVASFEEVANAKLQQETAEQLEEKLYALASEFGKLRKKSLHDVFEALGLDNEKHPNRSIDELNKAIEKLTAWIDKAKKGDEQK
jgi:hypothetical protein